MGPYKKEEYKTLYGKVITEYYKDYTGNTEVLVTFVDNNGDVVSEIFLQSIDLDILKDIIKEFEDSSKEENN